jgi:hypothetical protein
MPAKNILVKCIYKKINCQVYSVITYYYKIHSKKFINLSFPLLVVVHAYPSIYECLINLY